MNEAAPLSLRPSCPLYCPHTARPPTKPVSQTSSTCPYFSASAHTTPSARNVFPTQHPCQNTHSASFMKLSLTIHCLNLKWLHFPMSPPCTEWVPSTPFQAVTCIPLCDLKQASTPDFGLSIQSVQMYPMTLPTLPFCDLTSLGFREDKTLKSPSGAFDSWAPRPKNQFLRYYKLIDLLTKQINKFLLNTIIAKDLTHIPSLGFYCRGS